jgi:acyl-CoA synthetase (AMP-forming)/AMP-acid ligase II
MTREGARPSDAGERHRDDGRPAVDQPPRTVPALLRSWSIRRPAAPYLVDGHTHRAWTYREFDVLTDAVTRALVAAGVRPGDRVGTLMPNGPEAAALFVAALKAGAIFNPMNPALTTDEITYVVGNSVPHLICTTPRLAHKLTDRVAAERIVTIGSTAHPWFTGPDAPPVDRDLPPGTPALLLYTSGTTGRPKGAVLTHDNLVTNADQIARWLALGPDDRMLTTMPLFHANALVIGLTVPLHCGGSTVVCERFSVRTFWESVETFQPTAFGSVATMLAMLLARGGPPPRRGRHRVRYALCGSAPVPVDVIERFQSLTGIPVIEGYGLTECTCRATFNPPHDPRPGSVGVPIGAGLRIVDDSGRDQPPGVPGEILIGGPTVMARYFRDPGATRDALRDGWLHSGDVGYRTADGFVYLVGRKSDMIIRGGENIYPREIEDVVYRMPEIREAAVFGRPHPLYGEEVVACVSADPGQGLTPERVSAHCSKHLASFKCPAVVHVLDELPKNATGKLDKRALRLRFSDDTQG